MSKTARTKTREAARAKKTVAAARKQNRMGLVAVVGGAVILALVIAIIAVVVTSVSKKNSPSAAPSGPVVAPAGATQDGAILVGDASAPVRLTVYQDYMCPICGKFEKANGAEIQRLLADKKIRLEMHPLSFLDEMSNGTKYSTRAANAAVTVADRAPSALLAFNKALYDNQPAEKSNGLSDAKIASLATGAGVPKDVVDLFANQKFQPWVAKWTSDALGAGGITGTPTVKINGKLFGGDLYSTGPLTQAIEAAAGGQS